MIEVLAGIRTKLPAPPQKKSIFWPLGEGRLSRTHPSQTEMEIEHGKPSKKLQLHPPAASA